MKECEFCKESFREGCNASLIEERLKVFNSADMYIGVDVFITDSELELYLDDPAVDAILKRKIKINFCPICGMRIKTPAELTAEKVIGDVTEFIFKSEKEEK